MFGTFVRRRQHILCTICCWLKQTFRRLSLTNKTHKTKSLNKTQRFSNINNTSLSLTIFGHILSCEFHSERKPGMTPYRVKKSQKASLAILAIDANSFSYFFSLHRVGQIVRYEANLKASLCATLTI